MPSRLAAVTVDANGTLVQLADPVPALRAALEARGVERDPATVGSAFAAEVRFYIPRAHEGRDSASLTALRRACVEVFLRNASADLDPGEFAPSFLAALRFEAMPGARQALDELRARGLRLACVSNWDVSLREMLDEADLTEQLDAIVSSAEAGAPKPDPAPFRLALARLGTEPGQTLHCGDDAADGQGAAAAGLRFAPAPLSTLPARLATEAT
jgi:putative hydrolase of the HAD superfamily